MKNRIFIFLASLSLSLFALSFSLAFAQDAIQCKPPSDVKSGINLINNLRMVNDGNDSLNDIYLGTGEIYFGSTFVNTPYATNSGGNLLFRNDSANITTQSNTIIFQNTAGNRMVGIYNGGAVPAAVNSSRYLIVDGKIEGYQVNGSNELCVQGTCIKSWNEASGGPNSNINYVTTTNGWTEQHFNANSRLVMESGSTMIIQQGASINNYGTYQVCKDIANNNNIPETDPNFATRFDEDDCGGTGRGVSKIIDGGDGIEITSDPNDGNTAPTPFGEGDVTIKNTGVTKITAGTPNVTIAPISGVGPVTISVSSNSYSFSCVDKPYGINDAGPTNCPGPGWYVTGWDLGQTGTMVCCHLNP